MSIKVAESDIGIESGSLRIRSASIDCQLNKLFAGACPRLVDTNLCRCLHLCTQRELEELPLSSEDILSSCRKELDGSFFVVVKVLSDQQHIPFSSSAALYPFAQAWRESLGLGPRDFYVTTIYDKKAGRDAGNGSASARVGSCRIPLSIQDLNLWRGTMNKQIMQSQRGEPTKLSPSLVSGFLGSVVDHMTDSLAQEQAAGADLTIGYVKFLKCYCRAASCCDDFEAVLRACRIHDSLEKSPRDAKGDWFKGYALFKLSRFAEAMPLLEASLRKRWEAPTSVSASFPIEATLVSCCLALQQRICSPPLLKFPRTPHLFHPIGSTAVTEDDQVLQASDKLPEQFSNDSSTVILQEKIDGSNLGLTLSLDGTEILAHNRSHFLSKRTSNEHPQYQPLRSWIAQHLTALIQVLDRPSQWILYGEWVVARHSVPYQRLPGYFIAFDLYHIPSQRFVSQATLAQHLNGTQIPMAPSLSTIQLTTDHWKRQLLDLVAHRPSHFRSDGGPMEGIVLRVEQDGYLIHRSKLVRPDFARGTVWSKHTIERQGVDPDAYTTY